MENFKGHVYRSVWDTPKECTDGAQRRYSQYVEYSTGRSKELRYGTIKREQTIKWVQAGKYCEKTLILYYRLTFNRINLSQVTNRTWNPSKGRILLALPVAATTRLKRRLKRRRIKISRDRRLVRQPFCRGIIISSLSHIPDFPMRLISIFMQLKP